MLKSGSTRLVGMLFTLGVVLAIVIPCPARQESSTPAKAQDAAAPCAVQTGCTQPAQSTSLGDLARAERAKQAKARVKPAKLYTNDTLPATAGNLTVLGPSEGQGEAEAAAGTPVSQVRHDEKYYEAEGRTLNQNLEIHEGELAVLQQQLGQSQVQYFSNPTEELEQEHSRGEINATREAIAQKQRQVDNDRQAISGLEDSLRREGGDPNWLHAGQTGISVALQPDLSGVKRGSEEYWRRRFAAAREALARAQEERELAENELKLLQSQQAHDWGTGAAAAADGKITAKQSEVESAKAAEAQAQQDLDALEKEFETSGAPAEWAQPAEAPSDDPNPSQKPDQQSPTVSP